MPDGDAPKEFPDVSQKLSAPKKLSAFEKERQAAEQKRRREEAENKALLETFEQDFEQDEGINNDDFDGFPRFGQPPSGPRGSGMGFGGPPGRSGAPPRSGPGSLGPVSGAHVPNLKRKRQLDELREAQEARRDHEDFTAEYLGRKDGHSHHASRGRDEETQYDVAPRPTVQLSNLPPSSSEQDVKAMLRGQLQVYSVQFQPPPGPVSTGRRSATAIAQLSTETSTQQIESAVSTLKGNYLGCGYTLSISRHLSSTSLQANMPIAVSASSASSAEPFGAQKIDRDQPARFSMRTAPPPGQFAPPGFQEPRGQHSAPANAFVPVEPPADLNTMRAVHSLVDRLLSEPNPGRALQVEALLMALPEVQQDERFAFLYDSRSPAGAYYRFLLWSNNAFDMIQANKRSARGPERVLDDVVIDWLPPTNSLPFADLTSLGEILDHENYPSDDESDYDEDSGEKSGEKPPQPNESAHLTPLHVAKLSWLLSRMPNSPAKLRKGQVAAITSFAIRHARVGSEQIVNMLILNIEKPYAHTMCAKFGEEDVVQQDEDDEYEPGQELPTMQEAPSAEPPAVKEEPDDPSEVKLVALYLINDILHSCATATNAWRYRSLFESAFKQRKTFEYLEQLPRELGWGLYKAGRWMDRIKALLDIWGAKNIFALDSFEAFKKVFLEKPNGSDASHVKQEEKKYEEKLKGRFKPIAGPSSGSASPAPALQDSRPRSPAADLDGIPMEDLDGLPMEDLDDVPLDDLDGEPMEDLDGVPMDDIDGVPMQDVDAETVFKQPADDAKMTDTPGDALTSEPPTSGSKKAGFTIKGSTGSQPPRAEPPRRKLAEDMFADSDEE